MSPKTQGFEFPAEWSQHASTWLSFPQNKETWENRLPKVIKQYNDFIAAISQNELVNIISLNDQHTHEIFDSLAKTNVNFDNINIHAWGTNDSWCRDHGPAFLVNRKQNKKMLVDWGYNAWGGKYPPFDLDNEVPSKVASYLNLPFVRPGIIMEGGSVEFNGQGDIITTEACLLNKNRNPHLNKRQIEEILRQYYGVEKIHWLRDGIVGDDTDGHIDDTVRFVNPETVVAAVEPNKSDANHHPLQENLELLKGLKLNNGSNLNIVELPMPSPVFSEGIRLPASYANFYICNDQVIVPIYNCKNDDRALKIIAECFPDRTVLGLDSTEIIWGLGSFHCLSQQEPQL